MVTYGDLTQAEKFNAGQRFLSPTEQCRIGEALLHKYGDYSFEVPPVCVAMWDFHSWEKYIESCKTHKQ
jgi:hypothetical protein